MSAAISQKSAVKAYSCTNLSCWASRTKACCQG